MRFTTTQERAIGAVVDWHNTGGHEPFRLFGYAGTGKTTIAREIAQRIGRNVQFAAFTAKAAFVLNSKGCPARTIHSLIYLPKNKSRAKLDRLRKLLDKAVLDNAPAEDIAAYSREIKEEEENLSRPGFELNLDSAMAACKLIIIDEASMINEEIGEDLARWNVPMLALGDPAQLPPVYGSPYFSAEDPDVLLTEIHRQAEHSGIIQLASLVRQGASWSKFSGYDDVQIVPKGTLSIGDLLSAGQVICGTNSTRHTINSLARKHLGYAHSAVPVVGDKIICVQNNSNVNAVNGMVGQVSHVYSKNASYLDCDVMVEGQGLTRWYLQARRFTVPDWRERDDNTVAADYGYAITAHKAQGSQWDHVIVIDESGKFGQDRKRWLYTAVTRAEEKLTVVVS